MGKAAAGAVKAGAAYVEIGADDAKLKKGVTSAKAQMKAFASGMSSLGRKIALAGTAMLAPLTAAVFKFASFGDQIAKMAKRTGLSTEAVSRLSHAAQLSGTSLEGLEVGLKRMSRVLFDAKLGLGEAKRAFEALGVTTAEMEGKTPEQQFLILAEALKNVKDASEKAALAQLVFGRAGTMLIPLFNEGAEGIKAMGKEAEELGIVLDEKAAAKAEKLTDDITRLKTALKGLAISVGTALVPAVTKLLDRFKVAVIGAIDWVKKNKELVTGIAATIVKIVALGVAMVAAGAAIKIFIGLLTAAKVAAVALQIVMANPIIVVVAAAVVALLALARHFGLVEAAFDSIRTKMTEGLPSPLTDAERKKMSRWHDKAREEQVGRTKDAKEEALIRKAIAGAEKRDEERRKARVKSRNDDIKKMNQIIKEGLLSPGFKPTPEAPLAPAVTAGMPAMPTVPTTAEGPTTGIVGTFAGRRASQMAGAGTLERESLNTEKLMARLLAIIANNTREGGMVLG